MFDSLCANESLFEGTVSFQQSEQAYHQRCERGNIPLEAVMAKERMKPACEGDKSVRTNANPVPATMTLVMVCTIARTRLNTNLSSYIQRYSPPKSARVAFRSLLIKASIEACINSLDPKLSSAKVTYDNSRSDHDDTIDRIVIQRNQRRSSDSSQPPQLGPHFPQYS
jgi:hypothetical protein